MVKSYTTENTAFSLNITKLKRTFGSFSSFFLSLYKSFIYLSIHINCCSK